MIDKESGKEIGKFLKFKEENNNDKFKKKKRGINIINKYY